MRLGFDQILTLELGWVRRQLVDQGVHDSASGLHEGRRGLDRRRREVGDSPDGSER